MRTHLSKLPLALVLGVVLVTGGCDSSTDPGDAPAVLPPAAFQFDDTFPEVGTARQARVGWNYLNGAFRVGVVSAIVGSWLAVPAALTEAATQAEPTVEDGTWIWENTVPIDQVTWTFRLEGAADQQTIDWRLLVSASDSVGTLVYDDFPLYTATTSLDGQTGDWLLYLPQDGQPVGVLAAEYTISSPTVREVTVSVPNTHPDPTAHGASVRYAANGTARLFDWREAPPAQTHLVTWDEFSKAGSITAWNFNSGLRACWDSNLDDVDC